jgi:hypothetical protein
MVARPPLVQLLVSDNDWFSLLVHVTKPDEESRTDKSNENSIS